MYTVRQLIDSELFGLLNEGDDTEREITVPFCCDLLSVAMGRAPAGCAWVTVMGNMNTLAVASLTDAACVIMAEGCLLDDVAASKAKIQGITVLKTELPIFQAALAVHRLLSGEGAVSGAAPCFGKAPYAGETPGASDAPDAGETPDTGERPC